MADVEPAPDRATVLDRDFRMLVGGALCDAEDGALFASTDPATGALLAEVPNASAADVDRADMIAVANDVDYGLAAVIVTNDLDAAHLTAEALHVGYVEVNGSVSFALGSPFGGAKQSGIGREGSFDELLSYTQLKSVNLRPRRV